MHFVVPQTLLHLHEPKYIELWDIDDTMVAFWDIRYELLYIMPCGVILYKPKFVRVFDVRNFILMYSITCSSGTHTHTTHTMHSTYMM